MVARNFLEIDNNILYPRKDDHEGVEGDGVVRMEFPLLNYGHYLVSEVFGHTHWYGRLLNLLVTTIGLFYFFRLVNMHFETRTAFYATLILTASIWFVFARKIMPDTFSASLVIIALFHVFNYYKNQKPLSIVWFVLIGCLGVLAKIPAVILLASLGGLVFARPYFSFKKTAVIVGTAIIGVVSYTWYFVWNPNLGQQYAGWSNDNRSIADGINDLLGHLPDLAEIFYFNALQGFVFTVFVIVGLIFAFINKERKNSMDHSLCFCHSVDVYVQGRLLFYSKQLLYHSIYSGNGLD